MNRPDRPETEILTPEAAVERLIALHEDAVEALRQALDRFFTQSIPPSSKERARFRYPELRLTYHCQGEVPQTTRAYAKVQLPGTYSVTVTHPAAFGLALVFIYRP